MIDSILNHRSIRDYKDTPISDEILDEILNAATRASNTGNMQIYSIIATKSDEIKEQLLPLHFNQQMVKKAPVVLTFCVDFNRFNKWCESRNANPGYDNFLSFYTASIDATIAAQNAALEAEAQGLGICYLGTTNYNADKIIDVLNLPKGVVPVTTLVIGYPNEKPKLTPRLPAEAVVHYEKYNDFSEEKINSIYEELEASESSKNFAKEHDKENLAQVFTQVRYTKANNEHFSKVLLNVIKKQGFLD